MLNRPSLSTKVEDSIPEERAFWVEGSTQWAKAFAEGIANGDLNPDTFKQVAKTFRKNGLPGAVGGDSNDPNRTGFRIENRFGPLSEGPLHRDIANTFRSGTYNDVITTKPTTLYRVIGDNGRVDGGYWTRTRPEGPLQSVIDSALDQDWGNTATRVVEMEIPAGTRLFEGVAAPQRGLVGGGNQIYFDRTINPLDPAWIQ